VTSAADDAAVDTADTASAAEQTGCFEIESLRLNLEIAALEGEFMRGRSRFLLHPKEKKKTR